MSRDTAIPRTTDLPRVCADIRSRFPVSGVASQAGVKLHRAGRELKGCCPFHPDRSPSFTIYADDRRFQCFGCGAEGDVLDFVQRAYGVKLLSAIEMLDGGALRELEQQHVVATPKADWSKAARSIWAEAAEIAGTPAERYLRSRGITMPLPDTLRFGRLSAGTAMLPRMELADVTRAVVIGADGDAPGETAANKAAHAFAAAGRKVRIMRPAAGYKDFNAELMGTGQ